MEQSKDSIENSLFPFPSEWKNEFRREWYEQNKIMGKKYLDERWADYSRLFDMIYKNQRTVYEKKKFELEVSLTPLNSQEELNTQIIKLLEVTGCHNILDAISYVSQLQTKISRLKSEIREFKRFEQLNRDL